MPLKQHFTVNDGSQPAPLGEMLSSVPEGGTPLAERPTMTIMWPTIRRIESQDANVLKYVFERPDAVAESVLYKYPTYEQRTVICCSTQSGCPVGCRFCGAGDSFVRSLTSEEIISQVTHVLEDERVDTSKVERMQIMFMSMGEPMLNQRALIPALHYLHNRYPRAALLVSTSGPEVSYVPLLSAAQEIPTVGLQFSVHESTNAARDALIPFKAKLDLEGIASTGEWFYNATGRRPFFNYCAHEGNTSQEDAARLFALFNPAVWNATISVVCERDESVAAANERQRELASSFMSKLVRLGYDTRMFDPAGQDDIGGGCGQLFHTQRWMRKNPDQVYPSVGRLLPVIHAPRVCKP